MKRFIYALVLATVGAGAPIAADENSKVTLVYEHALPNVSGKSIKGVLVEYGPGGSSPAPVVEPPGSPRSSSGSARIFAEWVAWPASSGPRQTLAWRHGSPI